MLPNIVAEDGMQALGNGAVLIGGGNNFDFALVVSGEPDPSAAELAGAGGVELLLKSLEVAEGFLDDIGDGPGRIASAVGLHDVPEHGVINVAAAVVANGAADIFGDRVEVAEEIFRSFLIQLGMFIQGRIEVLHIGGMMHVVVQMHRFLVDGRFERRVVIRQRGQFVRHFHFLQSLGHFVFLQSLKDDGVRWKDSWRTGVVVPATPYICNISGGPAGRRGQSIRLFSGGARPYNSCSPLCGSKIGEGL